MRMLLSTAWSHLTLHQTRSAQAPQRYLGRQSSRPNAPFDSTYEWANPRHLRCKAACDGGCVCGDREACVKEYLLNLLADGPRVRRARAQLAGITGGCTCAPLLCHVHALVFVANASWVELDALYSALGVSTPG